MKKKLSDDELTSLKTLNSEYASMKMRLGELEITKSVVLKDIDNIKQAFGILESQLIEKYGKDSAINIETGEVTEAAKAN
jgi:hypothetical protein